jgi:hypothetical protein
VKQQAIYLVRKTCPTEDTRKYGHRWQSLPHRIHWSPVRITSSQGPDRERATLLLERLYEHEKQCDMLKSGHEYATVCT